MLCNSFAVAFCCILYAYCIHAYFYPFPMCDSSSTEPVFVLGWVAPGVPACPPSCWQTHVHSTAIHLTSGLTSSYPCKYVQGQESEGKKDTVFLHLRFLNWRSGLRWGRGGARNGDMNSLLSLVKYLSACLLLGILEFIGCSKGCWLILKAVFDRRYWVFEANRHNKMFSRHLND